MDVMTVGIGDPKSPVCKSMVQLVSAMPTFPSKVFTLQSRSNASVNENTRGAQLQVTGELEGLLVGFIVGVALGEAEGLEVGEVL